MKYKSKSKRMTFVSVLVLAVVIGGALLLRANGSVAGTTEGQPEMAANVPSEPPDILINHEQETHPISNYAVLKSSWNGQKYDRMSFYQAAWYSEPALLTGLRRLKPGERMQVDFGAYPPDQVEVVMAFLTDSLNESLLPVQDVSTARAGDSSVYEFVNPPAASGDIPTSGRVFSVIASWGDNVCEYVFASDGKYDQAQQDGQAIR